MENTRIVEQQRKTALKAEEIQLFKESFVIVPYQASGFLNYTNNGYNNDNINPNDFETFKRVWTGNDACVISWKNSVSLVQQEDNTMKINFQLGEVFCGAIQTNDSENRIQNDASFSEYKAQDIKKTINFYVNSYFEITDYYLLMFYKIPEYSGSTLYRLANIERDYVGKQLVGYVLTFETINQDLANTGKAKQQNIMPNSPGQGYLECVVKDSGWIEEIGKENFDKLVEGTDYYKFYDRYITADFSKIKNNPARKVVVKLLGNGILHSFVMLGRNVYDINSLEAKPQRVLFPINLTNPTTPTLFRTQSNSQNFYFGNFSPTLLYWKDLMSYFKDILGPVNKFKYEGWLQYKYSDLTATNIIENGTYQNSLFGYYNNGILNKWNFTAPTETITTSTNYGTANNFQVGGYKSIENHLWDNFWTQKQIKTLPINVKESFNYGLTIASGIGLMGYGGFAFFAGALLAAIGIVGLFQQKTNTKFLQSFRGIISAPFVDYINDFIKPSDGTNALPFNSITNADNSESPNEIFFDGTTMNISFEADITDSFVSSKIKKPDGSFKTLSTINIGQTTFENGDNILSDGTQYLVDGSESLVLNSNVFGYIIDGFKLQATFDGEISVEFLDINNEVIWSGIYQSEGKWTKSMREIWTEKNTSVFGRENVYFSNPIPYPKPIPEILPPQPDYISPPTQLICGKQIRNGSQMNWFADLDNENWFNFSTGPSLSKNYHTNLNTYHGQSLELNFKLFTYNETITNFNDFKNTFQNMKLTMEQKAIFSGNLGFYHNQNTRTAIINQFDKSYFLPTNIIYIKNNELNIVYSPTLINKTGEIKYYNDNYFEAYITTPTNTFNYQFYEIGNDLYVKYNMVLKKCNNQDKVSLKFYIDTDGALTQYAGCINGTIDYRLLLTPEFLKS